MNSKKILNTLIISGAFLFAVYPQEANIELPDLTTEVTGDSAVFEKAELPDFSTVVALPQDSSDLVPELPQAETEVPEDAAANNTPGEPQKTVYIEGQVGGGYPATFISDFKVSDQGGANPFVLVFDHRASAGFSGNDLSAGYSMDNTKIDIGQWIYGRNFSSRFGGFYEDTTNGLQSKVAGVSSVRQQQIYGTGYIDWQLPLDFSLCVGGDATLYNRYLNTSDSGIVSEKWALKSDLISCNPYFTAEWVAEDSKENNYEVDFNSAYYLLSDIGNSLTGNMVHRGNFDLSFMWANKMLYTKAKASAVIGNHIGENKVLPPFDIVFGGKFVNKASTWYTSFDLSGGLQSSASSIVEQEKNFKYSAFSLMPEEVTDWYGTLKLNLVSFTNQLSFTSQVDFKKTAFGNGTYESLYSVAPVSGLYGYNKYDRTILSTDFAMAYNYKMFSAAAKFKSNWLDVPVLDNKHTLLVDLSLHDVPGKWGVDLETGIHFGAADFTPVINANGFVQLTKNVKLVLSVDDFCRLIDMEDRIYAGDYICESGSVTMLVKFLF